MLPGAPGSLTPVPAPHQRGHCHLVQPALCCPRERQRGQSSSYPLPRVPTRFLVFDVLFSSVLFPPTQGWNLFSGRLTVCKSSLSAGVRPRQQSPGFLPWCSTETSVGSTAHTVVCLLHTWCRSRGDSSRAPDATDVLLFLVTISSGA